MNKGWPNPVQVAPYVPAILLKVIGYYESEECYPYGKPFGWYQFIADYGNIGPTLVASDCGYGIMQITSPMVNATEAQRLGINRDKVASNYIYNIGTGAVVLIDKWNMDIPAIGENDPEIIEEWYFAVWAYNGAVFKNNPNNTTRYDPNRPPYNGTQLKALYPYQELIWGRAANSPGTQFWESIPLTLPDRNLIGNWLIGGWPDTSLSWIPCPQPSHIDPIDDDCFFADLDCDGDIDTEDVRRIALLWNTQVGDALYNLEYDFNYDDKINLLDVRKVAQYWGQTAPFSSPAAPPLATLIPTSAGAEAAIVKINPPDQGIAVGATSIISIEIEDVSNLGAIEFTLRYNPSIIEIQADSVEIGDFLPKNRLFPLGPRFKNVDGLREFTYGLSLLGNEPGPSGNGTLARITVKGLASGTTMLNLRDVQVVDATLQVKQIAVEIKDGSIIILPDIVSGVELEAIIQNSNTLEILPIRSELLQNYPNPFNPETWIPYQLTKPAEVTIRIYDIRGQLARSLYLGYRSAGFHISKNRAAYWNGLNDAGEKSASGVYFYTIQAGSFTNIRKMILAK